MNASSLSNKIVALLIAVWITTPAIAVVRYVNADATGANNGVSWADGFKELVSAINAAQSGDEIWVADGIYYPDFDPTTGQHTGNRTLRFGMKSNISLFGGFAGGETLRSQRNWVANRTILSGDIGVRGEFSDNTRTIMAYPTNASPLTGFLAEGFVFSSGNANDPAELGNGIVGGSGGAVYILWGEAQFRNCAFVGNYAVYGAGVDIENTTATGLTLTSCLFAGNTARYVGGAVNFQSYTGRFEVRNCTIVNNSASRGSAIGVNTLATTIYVNNIVHGNPGDPGWEKLEVGNTNPISQNNLVQEALSPLGLNNIVTADAGFARVPSAGTDGRWGTMDDVLDATLGPDSPAIGGATPGYLPADLTDLDGDTNTTETAPLDFARNPRVFGAVADMGAFEFIDTQTRAPILSLPLANSANRAPLSVSYTLREPALHGSVRLRFGGTNELTIAAAGETSGIHQFAFDPANPMNSSMIASGQAVPDGLYDVVLSYRDSLGNPAASATAVAVTLDTQVPVLTLESGSVAYLENDPFTLISPNAAASDGNGNWIGATLEVRIKMGARATDSISIESGTGLTVLDPFVYYNKLRIANVSAKGGTVSADGSMTVTFNRFASNESVRATVRAIAFANSSDNPEAGVRTVEFILTDGALSASTAIRDIVVTPSNDPARVVTAAGTTTFVEGVYEPARAVQINPLATLVDPDSNTFTAATVVIGDGFAPAEDLLSFTATAETGDIDGSYAAATGILSLTSAGGSATLAQWQEALRNVGYNNLSDAPSTQLRVIGFAVNDGFGMGEFSTRPLQVEARNDPPIPQNAEISVFEDTATALTLRAVDPEGDLTTVTIYDGPFYGVLSGVAPNLVYTPNPDFSGQDYVGFTVFDGELLVYDYAVINVLPVDDAPKLTALPDLILREDSGTQGLPLAGIGSGASDEFQALVVSATSSNPAMLPDPLVFYSSPDSAGILSLMPNADANGSATVTVTVSDGHSVTARTFTVTVNAINDAPGFVPGNDISVAQDAGRQVLRGWATQIKAGPADEIGQAVRFFATTNHPEYFHVQPALSPDGTLTFTPAGRASGIAEVEVFLRDNGGNELGGSGSSEPALLRIAVTTFKEERGTYHGLLSAVGHAASFAGTGSIQTTLDKSGNMTGSLRLGKSRYSFKGQIGKDGVGQFGVLMNIDDPKNAPSRLSLALQVDVSDGTRIIGILSKRGIPIAEVDARKAQHPERPIPASLQGSHTFLLSPESSDSALDRVPIGHGFGRFSVSKSGVVSLAGILPDGRHVTCAVPMTVENTFPLYCAIGAGANSISGWASFDADTGESNADAIWFKAASSKRPLFPTGWPDGFRTTFSSSRYVDLAPIIPGMDESSSAGNARLLLSDQPETAVNIGPGNRVDIVGQAPANLRIEFTRSGLFKGSFIEPGTLRVTKFQGAVIQAQQRAAGFFLRQSSSGTVEILPTVAP